MTEIDNIKAVDSHTMGEPTRIVTGGIPRILKKTMAEKKKYLEKEMDHLRTAIMHEPRGHNNMFGSIITEPVNEGVDFGIIFMDAGGYLNMCGHGAIGAITVAIETKMVEVVEPVTHIKMDTPAGIVTAKAKVSNGKAQEVSIVNVPSFLYKKDLVVEMPNIGKVKFDISFGGSFFAIVHADQLGLKIEPESSSKLKDIAMELRDIINEKIEVQHPTLNYINTVDLIEIYDAPTHPDADYKNVVVFGQGQVDRSPCGTGTSAKLAKLYAKGEIKIGQDFVYESILGTLFKARIVGTGELKGFTTVTVEITGAAYITGFNHFVLDPEDPVKYGFILK
ncbi:MAG: proline racemase [Alkaliphilus sp.]|nr:proline racemase [Alkaliphilus sp. AH-315-G20]MBN4069843.1 proline racemase [bacterium AH-315-G05]PHS32810.1 MAG: proline racemase [Alkaliphilus sp.]